MNVSTEQHSRREHRRTLSLRQPQPRRFHRLPLFLLSLPLLLFLLLPLLALVLRVDVAHLGRHLVDSRVIQAISLSLKTSLLTTLLALGMGTPVAYLLARRRFWGSTLLDTLIDLPMVLPPSVAGIALLIAFGRRGIFGQYLSDVGISLAFTQIAVVMAQTFVAAPFYIKAAAAGFASVEPELEQAAAIDGASSWRIFRAITLPLSRGALLGGLVMTWARAIGEFGATIIFAGNFPGRTQTMPLAIYLGFELDLGIALALSFILLGVSFVVLFVVRRVLGQSITRF